jgi:hypothetical protein
MDDLDLERELHAALTVTPSPEFVARVREKIADAPAPSMLAGWLKPAGAIACAVVLAIAIGLPREEARLKPSPTEVALPREEARLKPSPTEAAPSPTEATEPPTVVVPTFPPPRVQRFGGPAVALAKAGRSADTRVALTSVEPPLPEVIIAPEDVEALQQFVAGTRQLRFVASFDETPASTPWVITDLSFSPVSIEQSDPAPVHNN